MKTSLSSLRKSSPESSIVIHCGKRYIDIEPDIDLRDLPRRLVKWVSANEFKNSITDLKTNTIELFYPVDTPIPDSFID